MKLKQYLTEDTDIVDIVQTLDKDCKPFIKDFRTSDRMRFLYRGMKKDIDFQKVTVRKDRKPKDMPVTLHNILDEKFKKKFGVKLRSQSLFVTADQQATQEYGRNHMIFPVGKYELYWSPEIKDLYSHIQDQYIPVKFEKRGVSVEMMTFFSSRDRRESYAYVLDKDWADGQKLAERRLDQIIKTYKKDTLKNVKRGYNEAMLVCKEAYIVSMTHRFKIMNWLEAYKYYSLRPEELRELG